MTHVLNLSTPLVYASPRLRSMASAHFAYLASLVAASVAG